VLTGQLSWVTLQGLGSTVGNLASGLAEKVSPSAATRQDGGDKLSSVSNGIAGPIAILGIIFPSARAAGFASLMLITAIISLTLAVMNILPIPALDGGRWFVTALFKVLKKPLKKSTEEKIHGTGFAVLMLLVVLVTAADIAKFGH
jgi:regulator of sigma E protease